MGRRNDNARLATAKVDEREILGIDIRLAHHAPEQSGIAWDIGAGMLAKLHRHSGKILTIDRFGRFDAMAPIEPLSDPLLAERKEAVNNRQGHRRRTCQTHRSLQTARKRSDA